MSRQKTFADYVGSTYPSLVRQAYLLTGNSADAADLVQSVLTRVAGRMRLPAPDDLDAYVRRSLVNAHISGLRRRWRGEVATGRLPEIPQAGGYERVEDRDGLARALQRLPARQRAALVLRFYEDRSEAETAEALGCRPGTVKSLVSRGLASLRENLGDLAESSSSGASGGR